MRVQRIQCVWKNSWHFLTGSIQIWDMTPIWNICCPLTLKAKRCMRRSPMEYCSGKFFPEHQFYYYRFYLLSITCNSMTDVIDNASTWLRVIAAQLSVLHNQCVALLQTFKTVFPEENEKLTSKRSYRFNRVRITCALRSHVRKLQYAWCLVSRMQGWCIWNGVILLQFLTPSQNCKIIFTKIKTLHWYLERHKLFVLQHDVYSKYLHSNVREMKLWLLMSTADSN